MNTLLHREGNDDLDDRSSGKDREITLGTTLILGIFFALAVLCAVFFGFGYSMGRKSLVAPAPIVAEAPSGGSFGGLKPSPGSPLSGSPDKPSGQTVTVPDASQIVVPGSIPAVKPRPIAAAELPSDPDGAVVGDPAPISASHPDQTQPSAIATPAPGGGGSMVQIAAVSHQEDADLLVNTLKRRGYNVAVHTEPQDKLLHVQIGPFPSHKDADAMRQRLLNDGFNAIVKDTH